MNRNTVGEYNAATGDWSPGSWQYYGSPKQTGAVRRASMDLTRSLAEMRRP